MTRLDIFSDPVCPWCLIGATNLVRALADAPDQPFELAWHPYQLDPDLPRAGMDRTDYLAKKFGGLGNVDRVHASVEQAAREAGVPLAFDRITRAPNTLDAHRLIRWAAAEGVQTRVAMALSARYFGEGEDISDPGVLVAVAADAGLDPAAIARLLAGDADRAEVAREAAEARRAGITGVPAFIVAGQYAVTGAQPRAFWTDVAREIAAATPPA
ncbi:MAG: DsbA family oxidoreductase [Amaricoccus sp.]|uniref:DsbA family oxidoreductase n=1 Tax=Amaricoccus sp. TaxID=1872485 RepID=UPI0039E54BD1